MFSSYLLDIDDAGIARFDDLQVRIPRDEVKEIERIVRECAER
jgi:hypothetical protein